MSNINDYLKWRGDIRISKEFPFNELDSLILARFSYLRFDKIDFKNESSIKTISLQMKNLKKEEFRFKDDKELLLNLGKSNRFKKMLVSDYIEIKDKSIEKQFGAVTIHLPNNEIYISYIGTDDTLIGWKEDFNMAFLNEIPAQSEGLKYAKNIIKKYNPNKIRIGGHSKGGNISIFVGLSLEKEIQDKIVSIDNFDGPGFDEKRIKFNENKELRKKITTYMPQESIIGRIFNHNENKVIVLSIAKGIAQHDIYSWNVLQNKFIKTKIKNSSELINKTIKDWLNNCSIEQRQAFFDSLFELFCSINVETISELKKLWYKKLPTLMSSYNNLSQEDKKMTSDMAMKLFKTYFLLFKKQTSLKFKKNEKNI